MKTLIESIGVLATGEYGAPPVRETSLVIEDGVIAAIGEDCTAPDRVIDAGGMTVMPGLVDGHIHPTFGQWTPAQNAIGWFHNYLHGGTTSMVSAGELHIPGLDFTALTPEIVTSIAILSRHTTGRMRPSGVKVTAGTVLLVPRMSEEHFDRLHAEGISQAKFIFYDWSLLGDGEAERYVQWCHDRGITVKMHSGGVSRSGSSRVAGVELVKAVQPDVVAHISGGPIPMPDGEIRQVVRETEDLALEVCYSMNFRATSVLTAELLEAGALERLTAGTDTPGGTGVAPRGLFRTLCLLAGMCGVPAVDAVAAATGSTAKAHGLETGILAPGRPADLLLLGPITGSEAQDALECLTLGDLPGIAGVLVDGEPLVDGRSEQTPPPRQQMTIR